MKVHFY